MVGNKHNIHICTSDHMKYVNVRMQKIEELSCIQKYFNITCT